MPRGMCKEHEPLLRQLAYKAPKVCSEAERASLEEGVEPPHLLDRVIGLPPPAAVEANNEAPPAHQTTPLRGGCPPESCQRSVDDSSQKDVGARGSLGKEVLEDFDL